MKKLFILVLICLIASPSLFAQLSTNDVALSKISAKTWGKPGELVEVSGVFKNLGTAVLQTLQVNWSVDETESHAFTMNNLNISKSIDSSFIHPDKIEVLGSEDIFLKVWVSHPNGVQDEKSRNDTLYHTIQVIAEFPEKGILLEEFTGAWCGWCPRGPITYRDQVLPNHPNVILAALHNGDDMVSNPGNTVVSAYAASFPSGMIDRKSINSRPISLSTGDWKDALDEMDTEFTPAEINVYNYFWPDTYEWKIDVVVDFIMDYSGDLRLNCIILEDSVRGIGSGYNQANYYNTRTDIPELNGAGNPINNYPHFHVVRDMIGGAWGQRDIIPSKVNRGDRYIFSRTIKFSEKYDIRKTHLVGVLQAYSSDIDYRPILNAKKVEVHMATGFSEADLPASVKIYPNPVNSLASIEINTSSSKEGILEICDVTGRIIHTENIQCRVGTQLIQIKTEDWKSGLYLVHFKQGNQIQHIKLMKNKGL